jgi:2-polyprenyl-3-methyl-5-hydroxy-6-metoxy-1,4-benzoquinol methylase
MRVRDLRAMIENRRNRADTYSKPEYWDSKAVEYADASVSMWPNNHLNAHYHREQVAWLDRYIGDVSGKRLLDAGCGFGRLSRYYAQRGARVVGFDFSARSIELALKMSRNDNLGDNPAFRVQSVFDLDERNQYDVVIVWGVLTIACRNPAELLDAATRLRSALVPGGRLLMMEPIHSSFLHRVLKLGIDEFAAVLRQAGFAIHDITHLHFWPARLALAYFPLPKVLTDTGYHVGDALLRLLGRKALGDYKAIFATVPAPANGTALNGEERPVPR